MGTAIRLRGDFDAAVLRRLAKRSRDGAQSRRFLALAMIYGGHRRSDAARFAARFRPSTASDGSRWRRSPTTSPAPSSR